MANSVAASGHFISGAKAVTTAGTAVQIEDGTFAFVRSITIIAESDNTGQIYVGGSDVASTTNAGLDSGDSLSITAPGGLKLTDIYIDASVSSDGVDFYGVK